MPVAVGVKIGKDGTVEVLPRVPSKIVPVTLTLTEEELNALTYDNSVVFDDAGNTIWVDARLSNPDFRQGREQAENRAKKHDLVLEVRKAYAEFDRNTLPRKNASVAAIIAQQFGINVSTVNKYVEMTDAEVEALLEVGQRKERVTGFDEYKNIAYVMLRDGYSIPDIMAYIKKMGCTLADLTIIRHIESVQSHHFPERSVKPFSTLKETAVYPEGTYVFGRARILKNILTIDEGKKDPELNKCMEAILSQYPICGTVQASFNAFHSAIMGNDISALDRYIEQYKNVPELSGFVRQLQQDIVPIRNAILLPYSSGRVEGLNCKFKLLKRIFFGRSKRFNLDIRFKCACAFFRDGFELGSVFPWFDAAFPRVA